MTADIEKKNTLSASEELANLKQEVSKQAPQAPKQEEKQDASISRKEVEKAVVENDRKQKENADKYLEK